MDKQRLRLSRSALGETVTVSRNLKPVVVTAALLASTVGLYGALGHGAPAAAQSAATGVADDACAKLAGLKLDQVVIDSARTQPANAPVVGARLTDMAGTPGKGPPVAGLPAFCRVVGHIHPEPGSDIGFEVWMPSEGWDGRFNGGNNGGFAGSIDYMGLGMAVKAGQAGVSTDTGHAGTGTESAWAKGHPERVRDYGWRGIHLTTVVGKKLVASYYGRGPEHSYFIGCSNGGRQALMEASRFPDDYDGIVAGAPAAVATDLIVAMTNTVQAQLPPGAALRPEQMRMLSSEVVSQCDALDGQVDGLIDDPRRCKLDVTKLACGANSSPQCFTPPQLAALRKIHAGPHDSAGRRVAFGYLPSGAEAGNPAPSLGWEAWMAEGRKGPTMHDSFTTGMLGDLVPKPFATPATFDFNKDPARLKAALGTELDATPDMGRFFARGGKLIVWQGWADAAIPLEATLAFRQKILASSGPKARTQMRMFVLPGVQHCAGGAGPDVIGQIGAPQRGDTPERSVGAAVQAWVETDRTPETLIGRRGIGGLMGMPESKPEKQRLICAYPAKAVLKPGADPDAAASYACRAASTERGGKKVARE